VKLSLNRPQTGETQMKFQPCYEVMINNRLYEVDKARYDSWKGRKCVSLKRDDGIVYTGKCVDTSPLSAFGDKLVAALSARQ
jgi:hypothetical protein